MSAEAWYVRDRNRVTGPFNREQLEALRRRGQLARFHQVSKDRQNWVSATTLADVFAPSTAVEVLEAAPVIQTPALDPTPVWFYASGQTPTGPVPAQTILDMLQAGTLSPDVPVWKDGFPSWVPFRDAASKGHFPTPSRGPAPFQAPGAPAQMQAAVRSNYTPAPQNPLPFIATYWIAIASLFGAGTLMTFSILAFAGAQGVGSEGSLLFLMAGFAGVVGLVCGLVAYILMMMQMHRTWHLIQPLRRLDPAEFTMPTPGAAIGFLFIPLFNVYWLFVAFYGMTVRTNKYLFHCVPGVPPMKEGLALCFCILKIIELVPYLNALAILVDIIVTFLLVLEIFRINNAIESQAGRAVA